MAEVPADGPGPPLDLPEEPVRFVFPEDPEDPPTARAIEAAVPEQARRKPLMDDRLPHDLHAARVPIVAALRQHGYSRSRIASNLKMGLHAVDWCIREARRRGELQKGMIEAAIMLEEEAVPRAVEAVIAAVRRGDEQTAIRILEGKGLLVNYAAKGDGAGASRPPMAFQFNFVMPNGAIASDRPALPDLPGNVVGVERTE